MSKKTYSPPKKKVSKWQQVLASVHGKLVKQLKVNEKLSPAKGKGGGGMGR